MRSAAAGTSVGTRVDVTRPSARSLAVRPRTIQLHNLHEISEYGALSKEDLHAIDVVARVLPFKTNSYVCEELIDWNAVPDDPIYRLTFPHRDMLAPADFDRVERLLRDKAAPDVVRREVARIQKGLNPHPAGQATDNVPIVNGRAVPGIQHKYRETVLFFPQQGQTCHAYCTYCFRWPQFVQLDGLKFASREVEDLVQYLRRHPEVEDVLFTGGDPLVMRTELLRRYIEPLLDPEFEGLRIRIGTKAPAYWPYRFNHGDDADALLRLFEEIVAADRHLAIMVHYTHPRELETPSAVEALRRILTTGAVVRCQTPVVRHVNDDADVLGALWTAQVDRGAVPYYLFVERDTGAHQYFEIPLVRALDLYNAALRGVSGLARTVRGPVMSAHPGKVHILGVTNVGEERVFVCQLLQSRIPDQTNEVCFARYDATATWFDDLVPAFDSAHGWFSRSPRPAQLADSTG